MHPIPLTDPKNRVRGYMCPTCKCVHTGSGLVCAAKGEDLKTARLQLAIEEADKCCRCRKCNAKTNPKELRNTTFIGRFGCCKKCGDEVAKEGKIRRRRYKVSEKTFNAEYNRRIALSRDMTAAYLLVGEMRELSEKMFCAGWDGSLEFSLWQDVLDGGFEPKNMLEAMLGHLSKPEAVKLRGLSRRAGGWWMWFTEPKGCKGQHAMGEVFVPMAEWKKIYAQHCASQGETR